MNNIEKKIVTTVVWSVSALFGLFMANWAYTNSQRHVG